MGGPRGGYVGPVTRQKAVDAIEQGIAALATRLEPGETKLRAALTKAANDIHEMAVSIGEEGYDTLHGREFADCPHPTCGENRAALADRLEPRETCPCGHDDSEHVHYCSADMTEDNCPCNAEYARLAADTEPEEEA